MKLSKTNDIHGDGESRLTVVMIHGVAADSSSYNEALEYFRGRNELHDVRFVTFDLLGAGSSPAGDELEYNYDEQVGALHDSIAALGITGPLVLIGHSLGTFIVTRYTSLYPDEVAKLILISPPIYTPADFENPAFMMGIEAFKQTIGARNPEIVASKAFQKSMENIVLRPDNYDTLRELSTPTTLIYGEGDQLIAAFNIPGLLKANPVISAIPTEGRHGITRDKYSEVANVLAGFLGEGQK